MSFVTYAKEIISDFFSTLYPENCLNCSDILVSNENYLCTTCALDLPKTNYHQLPDNPLFLKFVDNPLVVEAFAYLHFNQGGIAQSILRPLKYKSRPHIGEYFGSQFGEEIYHKDVFYDMIIPVPLHWRKKKKRGYNQSDMISRGLGKTLDIPVMEEIVTKRTQTTSQTKKTKVQRWKNVAETFQVLKPTQLVNKKVLLVDDVITTGATIGALCDELVKCDVSSISICSLATGVR